MPDTDLLSPDLDAAPGRRERERVARRRAILDAALVVFGEKGFEGATVDEVAERAEFGKGTLYNYFPGGKDELYLTLFEEIVIDGLVQAVHASIPDLDALTSAPAVQRAICDLVESLVGHFHANREHLFLFMKDGHRAMTDTDRAAFFARGFARVIDAIEQSVEASMAGGAMRRLPARPVAHLLMGAVRGYLMSESGCPAAGQAGLSDSTPRQAATMITTVLLDGLLTPAGSAEPPD